ncbi:LIC_13387 family protein [Sphingomonas sp.]|jgi:hypothetical protein|uniref:LIC_13387 family protein n=1 Tax=Sphingomonas sp. TaxID=28214 RepID=UPI002E3389D2|nr:hypothetical protein [Sphingomonas sp.]HEX4693931.1 hypothetical protein [Sphingomonas sp.]
MRASLFYRAAAILLVLFAVAHTLGFSQPDPQWHVDALVASMRSVHVDAMGSSRSYWDFFMAGGLCVGLFYLLSGVLACQLAGLPGETLAKMRTTIWALALCFAAVIVVSWLYLFVIPVAFSAVITLRLTAGAWLSPRS